MKTLIKRKFKQPIAGSVSVGKIHTFPKIPKMSGRIVEKCV